LIFFIKSTIINIISMCWVSSQNIFRTIDYFYANSIINCFIIRSLLSFRLRHFNCFFLYFSRFLFNITNRANCFAVDWWSSTSLNNGLIVKLWSISLSDSFFLFIRFIFFIFVLAIIIWIFRNFLGIGIKKTLFCFTFSIWFLSFHKFNK